MYHPTHYHLKAASLVTRIIRQLKRHKIVASSSDLKVLDNGVAWQGIYQRGKESENGNRRQVEFKDMILQGGLDNASSSLL